MVLKLKRKLNWFNLPNFESIHEFKAPLLIILCIRSISHKSFMVSFANYIFIKFPNFAYFQKIAIVVWIIEMKWWSILIIVHALHALIILEKPFLPLHQVSLEDLYFLGVIVCTNVVTATITFLCVRTWYEAPSTKSTPESNFLEQLLQESVQSQTQILQGLDSITRVRTKKQSVGFAHFHGAQPSCQKLHYFSTSRLHSWWRARDNKQLRKPSRHYWSCYFIGSNICHHSSW